jgi:hypothetical protein
MTSKNNQSKPDLLSFHWDHGASNASDIEKDIQTDQDVKRNLDEYLDFLDQVRPTIQELWRTIIFKQPFTLT